MTDSTLLIIAAAVVLLALVLLVLARTGRKPIEGPVAPPAIAPIAADEPLPEPAAAPGLPTAELVGATEPIAVAAGATDDLTRLKGLGPKAAALLAGMGVVRYAQIAGWSEADVARVDARMGAFQGRIVRDRWVEQAGLLDGGDIAAFEARFGRLG